MEPFNVRLPDLSNYRLVLTANRPAAEDAMCTWGGWPLNFHPDGRQYYLVPGNQVDEWCQATGAEFVNDLALTVEAWLQMGWPQEAGT